MTGLKTTIDDEWQMNSEASARDFNFYTFLNSMARNVRDNISNSRPNPTWQWWSRPVQNTDASRFIPQCF